MIHRRLSRLDKGIVIIRNSFKINTGALAASSTCPTASKEFRGKRLYATLFLSSELKCSVRVFVTSSTLLALNTLQSLPLMLSTLSERQPHIPLLFLNPSNIVNENVELRACYEWSHRSKDIFSVSRYVWTMGELKRDMTDSSDGVIRFLEFSCSWSERSSSMNTSFASWSISIRIALSTSDREGKKCL